jgi:RNase adapter protein RapZ
VTAKRTPAARTRSRPLPASFVVVTGLSGAGKSHAIRALEDLGYFCVDNLPIALVRTFADLSLAASGTARPAAVVVDVREGQHLAKFPAIYRGLKKRFGNRVRLLFFEAGNSALLRRFSETRRPHPLSSAGSVSEGLDQERRILLPIKRLADQVIDTSTLTVHELRRRVFEVTGTAGSPAPLAVTLLSFGFRRGVPVDADLVFDVRFLPNPHFVASLRRWSGRNASVSRYVLKSPDTKRFLLLTGNLLRFLLPKYVDEGKAYLTIAIGCTGGRHRSVAIANALATKLKDVKGVQLRVKHRDVSEE